LIFGDVAAFVLLARSNDGDVAFAGLRQTKIDKRIDT
jgi:hypothetical protein